MVMAVHEYNETPSTRQGKQLYFPGKLKLSNSSKQKEKKILKHPGFPLLQESSRRGSNFTLLVRIFFERLSNYVVSLET